MRATLRRVGSHLRAAALTVVLAVAIARRLAAVVAGGCATAVERCTTGAAPVLVQVLVLAALPVSTPVNSCNCKVRGGYRT